MRGSLNKLLLLSFVTGCAVDDAPPARGASDAGQAQDAQTRTDGGTADTEVPDSGRWFTEYRVIPPGEGDNFALAPDFDLSLFNLGWQAGGAQGGQVQLTRRIDARVPGIRKAWAELPGREAAPPRTFLAGFGRAPSARLRIDAWVGFSVSSTTTLGENVQVSLHGMSLGGDAVALVLEPDAARAVVVGGQRWVPHAAEATNVWVGFVTMLVLNGAAEPVGLNAPRIRVARDGRSDGRSLSSRPGLQRPAREEERRVLSQIWRVERARRRTGPPPAEGPLRARR